MVLYDKPNRTVVVFDSRGMEGHALQAMLDAEAVLRARFPKANILASTEAAVAWLADELLTPQRNVS